MHKKHKKSGGKNKNKQPQRDEQKRLLPEEQNVEQKTDDGEQVKQSAAKDASTGVDTAEAAAQEVIDGPVEIRHSDVMGRYLVAARDLSPGEWILRNVEPLVVGPCQGGCPALCVGCHELLEVPLRLGAHCPDCGLPMCGPRCPGTSHALECTLLREGGAAPLAPELLDLRPGLYNAIVPLRCLALRDTHPLKWAAIMKMEAHNQIRKSRPSIWHTNQQLVVDPIRNLWGLGGRFTEEEVHTVCGVLEVNAFEVGPEGCSVRALFPAAYLMAHDCTPNTSHTDDARRRLSVKAGVKINKGDAISLSYAYTLQGSLRRRQHLREGKFFECVCRRCADKTELGTFCSAFLCPKCSAPRVLPTDPLDDQAPWECVVCGNYSVSASSVDMLLRRLGDECEAIEAGDIPAFEKFLVKYAKLLPPKHYLMLCAKYSLCQLYGKVAGYLIPDLSDDLIKRKRDICEELLPIFDVLEPGMSRLRGITLYELHAPLMVLATRDFENRSIYKNDLKHQMKRVAECLEQAAEILELEPEGSSERQMADSAAQALLQVNQWRKHLANKK